MFNNPVAIKARKKLLVIAFLAIVLIVVFGIYWIFYLKTAHSAFENYYAFRGCSELLEKTNNYGICKTKSGETIKIVKFQNKWYLNGDLPCGFFCF